MGLLDKLFGKKKPQEETPIQSKKDDTPLYKYDASKGCLVNEAEQSEPEFTFEFEKIANERKKRLPEIIASIPGFEKYVLEKTQTESHAEVLSYKEFNPFVNDKFVVFDLETTGLDYKENEIVEIGAVRVVNGEITEEFSEMVKPTYPIEADATAVNHITNDMLENKKRIYEVLPHFLMFIGDDILAAHNVKFDYSFLAQACMICKFKTPERLFDSTILAKSYPEAGSKKLTALVKAAGIEMETAHRALSDARMTAKLILATYEKQKQKQKSSNASRCREEVEVIDHTLSGLRFCITGEIQGYERADIEKLIMQHDGKMTASVSGKTDYLVLGSNEQLGSGYISGKQKTAIELMNNGGKIRIISSEQFFAMVNNGIPENY